MRATTAWGLAAATVAAMLLASGTARVVLIVVAALVQVGLHVGALRATGPSPWRRVAVLWSVQASLTWLVAGESTTASVLVYIATGIVFALLAEVVLRLVGRFAPEDTGEDTGESDGARGDTAPLPVVDGET